MLSAESIAMWMTTININKVKAPGIREKLTFFQKEAATALHTHFFGSWGKAENKLGKMKSDEEKLDEGAVRILVAERALLRLVERGKMDPTEADLTLLRLCGVTFAPGSQAVTLQQKVLPTPPLDDDGTLPAHVAARFYGLTNQRFGRIVSWIAETKGEDLREAPYSAPRMWYVLNKPGLRVPVYRLTEAGLEAFAEFLSDYMKEYPDVVMEIRPDLRAHTTALQ
jgi:hypothetical protein